jgi:hypothetical protein
MKSYLILIGVLVLLLAAWITGCGGEPTAVAPSDQSSAAGSRRAEVRELKEATMTPLPTSEPTQVTPPPEAKQVVRLAVEDLAKRLDLATEEMRLVSVEAVDWPDTSLGCPQPGMMYAQVITPGYRIVLETQEETYDYHTDTGDHIILCQSEGRSQESEAPATPSAATGSQPLAVAEPPAGAEPPEGTEEVVRLAVEDLAKRLGLAPEAIQLISVEAMKWSDTSLGCPQPGMMYAQVITPGFLVVLEAEGEEYDYHTDVDRFVVLCEK